MTDTDTKARKLFARMNDELGALGKQIEQMLTVANAMKLTHSHAALALAEIEHRYVDQAFSKRKVDTLLHEAQEKLGVTLTGLKSALSDASNPVASAAKKLDRLGTQAKRVVGEPAIKDNEKGAPKPNLQYLTSARIADLLGVSPSYLTKLIQTGKFPEHDAVDEGQGGRPKFLWVNANAMVAILRVRRERTGECV